ncbi:MAG: DNA polymerase III chi subunit HolC [Idiomarinaceae bacterium HL-53]|nr:MAG: DNA polymerase III chi subunit HolC [Idiomarinaceae bacterium HL-53]CUS48518.1 DNA polymerase III, chi subunit [Idiomarinaceae bacterium HL-53]
MAKVTFYTLDEIGDDAKDQFIAQLIHQWVSQRLRVLVVANDQEQAEHYDEVLWQLPSDRFIPHNLVGEGPAQGTPVILAWQEVPTNCGHRHIILNLTAQPLPTPFRAQQIAELVPLDETLRTQAREHYRYYRQQQCQMNNVVARIETEGNHG